MAQPLTNPAPTNAPRAVETRLRVRYAETDQMGVVYHSNYVIWFEVGRVEWMRALGHTYRDLEREDVHLPVVDLRCRYKAPARYDDEIVVRTTLANLRGSLIHFHYEVRRSGEDLLLAEGETVHLVVDHAGNKRSFPARYLAAFRDAQS